MFFLFEKDNILSIIKYDQSHYINKKQTLPRNGYWTENYSERELFSMASLQSNRSWYWEQEMIY